jgi:hypothetical protein
MTKVWVIVLRDNRAKTCVIAAIMMCVWVYTPQNTLVSGGKLPVDGMYVLQVSVPQGTANFEMEVSLVDPNASPSSPASEAVAPISSPSSSTSSSVSSGSSLAVSPTPSPTSRQDLNKAEAVNLVQNWLNSKAQVFSSPWNHRLVDRYTTGTLHHDITKSGGSIDWLRSNGSHYKYNASQIQQVWAFTNTTSVPSLKVSIYEDRTLHGPRGIDYNQSGSSTRNYIYYFAKEGGSWKIHDYAQEN